MVKKNIIIICGYSKCDIKEYIKFIAQFIKCQTEPHVIIVSGKDEAEIIKRRLIQRAIKGSNIITENKSIDKKENIEFSAKIIKNFQFEVACIYIFCDILQKKQIHFDVKHYLNDYQLEIICFQIKRNCIYKFCQVFITLKDYLLYKNFNYIEKIYISIIKLFRKLPSKTKKWNQIAQKGDFYLTKACSYDSIAYYFVEH